MIDFAAARRNMVEGQIRPADVTDLRIQSAMLDVPRERFVPNAELAYLDIDIPLAEGAQARRMLKPVVIGRLLQALAPASARACARCCVWHRLLGGAACKAERRGDRSRR